MGCALRSTAYEDLGGMTVKRVLGLIIGMAFVAGTVGGALAQGQPAPAPAAPKEEKKAEKPAEMKRAAAHNASGTVKTATSDSLVVAGKAKGGKDAEWTFSVDPKTKIRKAGKDITAADLAAGDAVHVRYHEQAGKNVADSVMVRAAKKAAEAPKATDAPKKDETKK
jgi:Domain of unknown function (DUF5666)